MSDFKARSDYFKMICQSSKLIAHLQPVGADPTPVRESYFRINDQAELNSACANWIYFPCVAHVGFDIIYSQPVTGMPHEGISNNLYFLYKPDRTAYPLLPDAIEDAYDKAFDAMNKFISYLLEDHAANGCCGNLFLFNMNRAKAIQVGPFNDNLYGWYLSFYDEEKATGTVYNANDWLTPINAPVNAPTNSISDDDGSTIVDSDGSTILNQ